ncbi:MAG: transglycosylase domain-containing protein, partial [Holosporales bacterium]|nr:transglycosylase domain-containing protein [Holosporales bacterium]
DLYEDVVSVAELPKHVIAAFMAVEDKRFFQHFGIDFIGFIRAAYRNYVSGRVVQCGSTITQQLAKNILIGEGVVTHYDRSISRKIKELLLAMWLEHKFTKSDILMMYLNRVYFGAGTYGIDAASRKYFDKSAKNLSIFESAILAGLLKAPSKYSPSNHPNYAHERAMVVLKAMEDQGFIKSALEVEKQQAKAAFEHDTKSNKGYMYFCDYVYEQAKKILGDVEDDIIIVYTFNEDFLKAAEEAVEFYLKTEGENYKFSQASFVCMSREGAVLSIIGGANYTTTQFNRATQAVRMPGSAFKIFIYGAAMEYGYQLGDMIADTPISVAGWRPSNYKWVSRGQISVLTGFTHSVNSVSVRLAQSVGLKRIADFAKKLGIYDVSTHDLSVALGTTPVTLKDLTAAYTSFMDGMPIWPYCITEIRTKDGKILYQRTKVRMKSVLDKELLSNCRALLHSVVQNGTGRAAKVNNAVYGKTGTNEDLDAWFLGFYDPEKNRESGFSFGVWIGNDTNGVRMAPNSTGGRIPTRIIARFLKNFLNPSQSSGETPVEEVYAKAEEQQKTSNGGLGNLLGDI